MAEEQDDAGGVPIDRDANAETTPVDPVPIVRRYLEDHLGLRSPELTTEEFLDELSRSPDLVRSHRQRLEGFLKIADLVKFAHMVPNAADVEDSIEAAQQFIEETREITAPFASIERAAA